MNNPQWQMLNLLQESSGMVCDSGTQTVEFGERLIQLSRQLQQPTAVESLHSIVDELLAATLQMCVVNLTLTRNLDNYAEKALNLLCVSQA